MPPGHPASYTQPNILEKFETPSRTPAMFVPVTIEGDTYTCILDTGAMATVFNRNLASKFGEKYRSLKLGQAADGRRFTIEYYRPLPDVYLGALNIRDRIRFGRIIDFPPHVATIHGKQVDGIIGMDVLRDFVVQLDYDNGTVSLIESHKVRDFIPFYRRMPNAHSEWGEPIPLGYTSIFRLGLPTVKGTFSGAGPVEFIIDSGFLTAGKAGSVSEGLLKKHASINWIYRETYQSPGKTIAGENPATSELMIAEKLDIGPFEYNGVLFSLDYYTLLGTQILMQHLVTFDFPNKVMYLKRGDHFGVIRLPNIPLADIGLNLTSDGHRYSVGVLTNSVAYSYGFREDDIITEIDGRDVTDHEYATIGGLLYSIYESSTKDLVMTVVGLEGDRELRIPHSEMIKLAPQCPRCGKRH